MDATIRFLEYTDQQYSPGEEWTGPRSIAELYVARLVATWVHDPLAPKSAPVKAKAPEGEPEIPEHHEKLTEARDNRMMDARKVIKK